MISSVIEVRNVAKRFGAIRALEGVDLTVPEGELFGLIGHNGAGKTTLLRLMLGLLPPSAGEIRIDGELVLGNAFRRVRRRIGYLPENVALYDNLSGSETMLFFARLKGADPASCRVLLKKVGLAAAAQRPVRTYSKGMKQRLAFAQALLGRPRILFLDEPTNGLDPEGIREFYDIVRALCAEGVTAILGSHILAEIQQRVDRLAVMKTGRIEALGTVRGLREQSNLPLGIEVTLHNGAEDALRRVLSPHVQARVTGSTAYLQCEREQKMAVLGALSSLDKEVLDIRVKEPSLEEVFLGYTDIAS